MATTALAESVAANAVATAIALVEAAPAIARTTHRPIDHDQWTRQPEQQLLVRGTSPCGTGGTVDATPRLVRPSRPDELEILLAAEMDAPGSPIVPLADGDLVCTPQWLRAASVDAGISFDGSTSPVEYDGETGKPKFVLEDETTRRVRRLARAGGFLRRLLQLLLVAALVLVLVLAAARHFPGALRANVDDAASLSTFSSMSPPSAALDDASLSLNMQRRAKRLAGTAKVAGVLTLAHLAHVAIQAAASSPSVKLVATQAVKASPPAVKLIIAPAILAVGAAAQRGGTHVAAAAPMAVSTAPVLASKLGPPLTANLAPRLSTKLTTQIAKLTTPIAKAVGQTPAWRSLKAMVLDREGAIIGGTLAMVASYLF